MALQDNKAVNLGLAAPRIDHLLIRPGEIFSLPRNEFNPGDPADFFLFDPEEEWMVKPGNLRSKSCNTPFIGSNMHGRVKHHWIGGKKLL